jgi:hypothetical protein
MTQLTATPRTMKNQRCQPDEFASGVALVRDIDKRVDRHFVVQLDPFDDYPLRQLIERNDKYR